MKSEQEIVDEIVKKITTLLDKHDATLIAGALTALGFQIYKTLLNLKKNMQTCNNIFYKDQMI